jgi:PiT family inorganic phosphate transporter
VGFSCAAALLLLSKLLLKQPELYAAPKGDVPPPFGIRALLVLTCTGVSFAHGSNDGQKGMGLMMLILIGILPGAYALRPDPHSEDLQKIAIAARPVQAIFERRAGSAADASAELSAFLKRTGTAGAPTFAALAVRNRELIRMLEGQVPRDPRGMRVNIYLVSKSIAKLNALGELPDPAERAAALEYRADLDRLVNYIPAWVKAAVALALGLGTMIGWKRIVVTVGEKIGKVHLSYAQGAAAELVAMGTIATADLAGLPVSTTHVLSSGVAGTMAANRSGLQMDTVRNLLLAWVLTLPVCVLLGACLFAAALYVFLNVLGLK